MLDQLFIIMTPIFLNFMNHYCEFDMDSTNMNKITELLQDVF